MRAGCGVGAHCAAAVRRRCGLSCKGAAALAAGVRPVRRRCFGGEAALLRQCGPAATVRRRCGGGAVAV